MKRKHHSTAMMTTAIGMAAVAGTAAYMLSNSNNKDIRRKTKKMRRNTGRALRQVGGYIENISEMMQ